MNPCLSQWAERLRLPESQYTLVDLLRDEIGADPDGSIACAIQQVNVTHAVA
jgi:hypothetical protein